MHHNFSMESRKQRVTTVPMDPCGVPLTGRELVAKVYVITNRNLRPVFSSLRQVFRFGNSPEGDW